MSPFTIVGPLGEQQKQELKENRLNFKQYEDLSDEQLLDLYRSCDLVVLASTYEGFGLPIVEAQAVGRPVVTSNVCSMPEVAGDAAAFVDPVDVESIRKGIRRVIEDEAYRTALVEKGLANVRRFASKGLASRYAKLYRTIAENQALKGDTRPRE